MATGHQRFKVKTKPQVASGHQKFKARTKPSGHLKFKAKTKSPFEPLDRQLGKGGSAEHPGSLRNIAKREFKTDKVKPLNGSPAETGDASTSTPPWQSKSEGFDSFAPGPPPTGRLQPEQRGGSNGGGGGGDSGGGGGGGGAPPSPDEREQEEKPQRQAKVQDEDQDQEEEQEEGDQEEIEEIVEEIEDEGDDEERMADGSHYAGEESNPRITFPLVSSHLANNRLNTVAVCHTIHGPSIVNCSSKVRGRCGPRTPVRFGYEGNPPQIQHLLNTHKGVLIQKADSEKQSYFAGQLVERARVGDQNAMAIISLVRDNSRKGNPRAQTSFTLIRDYIDKHPVSSQFGCDSEEKNNPKNRNVVMLANGPPLTNNRVMALEASFGAEESREVFMNGLKYHRKTGQPAEVIDWLDSLKSSLDAIHQRVHEIGEIIGDARAIQVLRKTGDIKRFCPVIGWELGC